MAATRIMGGADFGNTSYRDEGPDEWKTRAGCRNRPPEWFGLVDLEDASVDEIIAANESNVTEGLRVCSTCPVRMECLAASNAADRKYTIRGGIAPLDYRGSGSRGRPTVRFCKYGHQTITPESRMSNGGCRACGRARFRMSEEGQAIFASTNIERGLCRNKIHDLNDAANRTDQGTCAPCQTAKIERKRAAQRAKTVVS